MDRRGAPVPACVSLPHQARAKIVANTNCGPINNGNYKPWPMSGAGYTFNDSPFYDVIDFSHALIGSRSIRAITRCEFSRFWVDWREQIIQSLIPIRLREIKHIYITKRFDRVFPAKSFKSKLSEVNSN